MATPRHLPSGKAKTLAPTTVDLYIQTLAAINGGKGFDSLAFLAKPAEVKKVIDTRACNTRKMMFATILTLLTFKPNKRLTNSYRKMFEAARDECAAVDPNMKTEKEKANWMSWDEVLVIYERYKKSAEQMDGLTRLNATNYRALLSYMILSLYVLLPPGRSLDYVAMYVMPEKGTGELTTDRNWLDLRNKTMVFNKYKTASAEGQQTVPYSDRPEFVKALSRYLKHNPDRHATHPYKFLVKKSGAEISNSKQMHEILNSIFAPKKISVSMLRHIYLSSKYDIAGMKEDAKLMRHSVEQQKEYLKV